MKAKIAPALAALRVPIDSVAPHPRNARQGDVGAISESLRRFGQLKPIVVQEATGQIVAGNHLWRAAVALGWAEIAVAKVTLSEADELAYVIADNRTQELGTYDQDALAGILTELATGANLRGTGYDGGDVDALLAELGRLPEVDPNAPPRGADDQGISVPSQYAVAVLCDDEAHQREVFDALTAVGYRTKVLTV